MKRVIGFFFMILLWILLFFVYPLSTGGGWVAVAFLNGCLILGAIIAVFLIWCFES